MPTWKSGDAFVGDLRKLAKALEGPDAHTIAMKMGRKAQDVARRTASGDLGGDPKFSGWAPTLDTKLKPLPDGALLTPTKRSAGPWTVAQDGRHSDGGVGRFQGPGINMRTGNTRRRRDGSVSTASRRRTGIRWNGVTAGKNTADKAQTAMERELQPIAKHEIKRAIARRFDVT